jgi:hypothetical protein
VENSNSGKTDGLEVRYSNERIKMGAIMMDIRNLAKTLKAARLMHEGKGIEGHKLLKNLRGEDLRDAARFVEDYPLLAEIIMRRGATEADTPSGNI